MFGSHSQTMSSNCSCLGVVALQSVPILQLTAVVDEAHVLRLDVAVFLGHLLHITSFFFGIELDHGSNKIDKDPKRKNCMFVEFHTKYPQQTENSPQKKIMQHVFKARTAVARPNSNSNAWRPGNLNCTA